MWSEAIQQWHSETEFENEPRWYLIMEIYIRILFVNPCAMSFDVQHCCCIKQNNREVGSNRSGLKRSNRLHCRPLLKVIPALWLGSSLLVSIIFDCKIIEVTFDQSLWESLLVTSTWMWCDLFGHFRNVDTTSNIDNHHRVNEIARDHRSLMRNDYLTESNICKIRHHNIRSCYSGCVAVNWTYIST